MLGFEYVRAAVIEDAVATVSGDPAAAYLAGGTTQLDLMLKDGVVAPERLVDITRLPLRGVNLDGNALRVGAMTTMEEPATPLFSQPESIAPPILPAPIRMIGPEDADDIYASPTVSKRTASMARFASMPDQITNWNA